MKTVPCSGLDKAMNECVKQINAVMDQLEPADRLKFLNQLIMRIMPDRKKTTSVSEKINKRQRNPLQSLSKDQCKLIEKLSQDTKNLFDFDGDHRA